MRWIMRTLRGLARVLGFALLFPIDCLLCLYDVIAVNLQKTGWFKYDCREPGEGDEVCRHCMKYTNRWLFRLICRDIELPDGSRTPLCGAREEVHIHAVRGFFAAVTMLALFVGSLAAVVLLWPELNPPQQDTKAVQRLLQERIKLAEAAFSEGNYEKALDLYRRALDQEDRPELRYRAGLCLEELGKRQEAMKQYSRAVQGENPIPEAAQELSVAAFENGRFLEAGRLATEALGGDIDDAVLHAIQAEACQLRGETDRADSHLSKAKAATSDDPLITLARARILSHRGKLEEAEKCLEAVEGDLSSSLPASLCRAELYWQRGKHEKSISEVKSVVDSHPETAGGHVLLVKLLLSAGRTEEALSQAESIREEYSFVPGLQLRMAQLLHNHGQAGLALELALDVQDEEGMKRSAHLLAAQIYQSRGLPRRALHHATTALDEAPDDEQALLLAGRAAMSMGKLGLAQEHFKDGTEVAPEDPRPHHLLARALIANEETKDAVKSFKKACELAPDSGELRYDYGKALIQAGRQQAAASQLQMAARQMSNPHGPLTRLGMMAQERGDTEAAIDYYSRAVGSDPRRAIVASNNLAALMLQEDKNKAMALALAYIARANTASSSTAEHAVDTLAQALIQTGNASTALVPARQAAEANPEDPSRQLRLGMAELAAGNRKKARGALQQAQKLAKTDKTRNRAKKLLKALRDANQSDS